MKVFLAGTVMAVSLLSGCAVMRADVRPAPEVMVPKTPEMVARGQYLFKHAMDCTGCHTALDPKTFAPDQTKFAAGGNLFGPEFGAPAKVYASNLTSDPKTGLGSWTDGEILRAIREGVSRDGRPLMPMMPSMNYHELSDDDAYALVAYIRTLKPVENRVPANEIGFPLNMLANTFPKRLDGPVPPPANDPLSRGKYLVKMAGCADCHSPMGPAGPDLSKAFAGGAFFKGEGLGPEGKGIKVPNISPDMETGIGSWTDAQIANAIRFGQRPDGKTLRPPMMWQNYNGLTDADVQAMVTYLRTVPAQKNVVDQRW